MTTISIANRLGIAVAALAGVLVLAQPVPSEARGGGFGGGGLHGGGFSGGGFHTGGMFGAGGLGGGGFHAGVGGHFHGDGFGGVGGQFVSIRRRPRYGKGQAAAA